MKVLFLEAPYKSKAELGHDVLTYIISKKYKTIGLYMAVQFVDSLDRIKKQLKEVEIKVVTSTPSRSQHKGQLLGCDVFSGNLQLKEEDRCEIDAYMYIGDGKFHPNALLYGQKDLQMDELREVICYDPISAKINVIKVEDIRGVLKRYRGALMKFLGAKRIGVISSLKPGQEFVKVSLMLEKKFPDKKFYFFIDESISFNQLENYNFIDLWVNTACPRIGFDDTEWFSRGIINLNDAFLVEEILSKNSVLNQI